MSTSPYHENLGVAKIERYAQRGRYLESIGTAELKERWASTLALYRRNVEAASAQRATDEIEAARLHALATMEQNEDIEAELALRGEQLPWERAGDNLAWLQQQLAERLADPDSMQALLEDVDEFTRTHLLKKKQPN